MIKILLLEKDPALAWLYREELEDAGFGVRVCRDTWEAERAICKDAAHMLLTDLASLPPGFEHWLCDMSLRHRAAVILMGSERPIETCLEGVPFVVKSSDISQLVGLVRRHAAKTLWYLSTAANC